MEFKRGKIITITSYIISIIVYLIASAFVYKLLIKLHYYYLFITIPTLFLFCSLTIFTFIKIILLSSSLIYSRNENTEIEEIINNKLEDTNRLLKYVLIGVFISLLTALMILDIIFCLSKNKIEFTAISIIIWVLLYYLIFTRIVKMIKKEIRL